MNDWVRISRRTIVFAVLEVALWGVGAITGLVSSRAMDLFDIINDAAMMGMFAIAIGMIVWAAFQCERRSLLRWGWLIVAAGFTVGFVATGLMIVTAGPSKYAFSGASPGITFGLIMGGLGLCVAAASTIHAPNRTWATLGAAALSAFIMAVMVSALLAPGPAMPFSIGPRDPLGIWRLAIDNGLMLFPMAFATVAQLTLPGAHRARMWMWAAVGALLMSMGDVASPLVDLGHGQIYPTMMWSLGIILLTVAASMCADFERAERAHDTVTSDTGALVAPRLDSQRFTTE